MKVNVQVEKGKGEKNFSCFMKETMPWGGLIGYGNSAREAVEDIYESLKEQKELMAKEGREMEDLEFDFKFDVGSLFNYYSYLNISGVARKTGISDSVLRQYASGVRRPSADRLKRIKEGLAAIAADLMAVELSNAC